MRNLDGATGVDQPLPLPEGVSDLAIGVTSGREPEMWWIATIAVALLAWGAVPWMRIRRLGATS